MTEPAPPTPLLRLAIFFYAALIGAAVVWARLAERPLLFASAEAAARGVAPLRDAASGALAGLLVVLLSGWLTRATRVGDRLARALAQLIGRRTTAECVALAALTRPKRVSEPVLILVAGVMGIAATFASS